MVLSVFFHELPAAYRAMCVRSSYPRILVDPRSWQCSHQSSSYKRYQSDTSVTVLLNIGGEIALFRYGALYSAYNTDKVVLGRRGRVPKSFHRVHFTVLE